MTQADDATRLAHMRDAASKVIDFSQGKPREALDTDEILCLALVRLLEIVGEAANRVSEATRKQHPEIPWPQIVGMRNRLIHGYDVIDLDILWQTIEHDVPKLLQALNTSNEDYADA